MLLNRERLFLNRINIVSYRKQQGFDENSMEGIDMTGFIVGLIIGTFVGIFVMCLMIIAKDDMPDIEDTQHK